MSPLVQPKGNTMPTMLASKAERGTKRTCQNTECGKRFYDLNRDPIVCPICTTTYSLAAVAPPPAPLARAYQRPMKKVVTEAAPDIGADDELPAIDAEESPDAEDDDTLIEDVEDGESDVAAIIDAPIEPDEKT
jgi:uncharacterized protein (TIGR02300 family)